MDRFTSMAVFVKVVEGNSFAAAARHFVVSPAMVSKHVQDLEERLGVRLLNRTTRHVSLTEVGRGYYERCRQILADVEESERAAGELQAAPRGVLRVSAPLSFGIHHLGPAIADFIARYPELSVDVTLNDRYIDLVEDGFDIAVRAAGRLPDSSLIARRLAPIRMVLCASPEYLARHGVPRVPADLARHNCLVYTFSATRGEWCFTGPDGKDEVIRISGRLQSNSVDILRAAALNGEGIILEPTFRIGEDLRTGRLVPLLPAFEPSEAGLYAVYPHSRHLSAKVRTFVDFLVARFGQEPEWDRWREAADAGNEGDGLDLPRQGFARLRGDIGVRR